MKRILIALTLFILIQAKGQDKKWQGKFEQLDQLLPTPNSYRTSSGAPETITGSSVPTTTLMLNSMTTLKFLPRRRPSPISITLRRH